MGVPGASEAHEERFARLLQRWWREDRPGWTELGWWEASLDESVLIADTLGLAADPAVPPETSGRLFELACTWARQRRDTELIEVQAATWPPVPDDLSGLDGGE